MTQPASGTDDEQTETISNGGFSDDDRPAVTCTLTPEQAGQREEWIEENVVPHVEAVEELEGGFSFVLDRNQEAYSSIADLAWKESRCCSWATFEVELPPGEETIRWNARSEREDGAAFFADALRNELRAFDLPG